MEEKEIKKVTVLNADQEEFERTYSHIVRDYMDWETYFQKTLTQMAQTKKEFDGIIASLELLETSEDENVQLIAKHFRKQVEEGEKVIETYEQSVPEFEERFNRSRDFFEKIKTNIHLNENNEATLGEGFLFLMEYFHTFMKVTEDGGQQQNGATQ